MNSVKVRHSANIPDELHLNCLNLTGVLLQSQFYSGRDLRTFRMGLELRFSRKGMRALANQVAASHLCQLGRLSVCHT